MDIFEFAKKIDGRTRGNEITKEEEKQAKELGFVVVFGASDDLMEFRGAIDDEFGCYNGGTAYLDANGLLAECDEECIHYKRAKDACNDIKAVWCDEVSCFNWYYETQIPHATFEVIETYDLPYDNLYCRGIVFDINAL